MNARAALVACVATLLSCADATPAREATLIAAITDADETHIRARPSLSAGKYARMARDAYSFFRGTVPVYRGDFRDPSIGVGVTRFPAAGPLPPGLGDPHVENFGLLEGGDGVLALEANDFDAADRYPYHWDLRRLTTSLVLACRLGNVEDPSARAALVASEQEVVRAAVEGYADGIASAARARVVSGDDAPLVVDLFRRGRRDQLARAELGALTTLVGGQRRLRRGVLDSADPEEALHELPLDGVEPLPGALMRYRATLLIAPEPAFFQVLDAARQVGSGVASWPRVRVLVVVRGASDAPEDDVVLELKEALDSGAEGWLPPGSYADDVQDRILRTTRESWAVPDADPFWGVTTWLGFPMQVRRESEAHKTLRVERIEGDEGNTGAMLGLAQTLGALLARIHATPALGAEDARAAIATAIARDPAGFVDDEVSVAVRYASRVLDDYALFRHALRERGATLGVPADERDRPSADLRALFGQPEPVQPWE